MSDLALGLRQMLKIEHELASQPLTWRKAAQTASVAAERLPKQGERLAIIGCGTSYFIAQAMASLREAAGHGETDAFAASEALLARDYDSVLAVSRSGTTTEVLNALERAPKRAKKVAICAVADTPIPGAVDDVVLLEFADEDSVVQTRFATAALALMRAVLDQPVDELSEAAEEALQQPLPPGLEDFNQIVFLAHGWGVGVANEAALKLREAAGAWTEAYPVMEYRHGPISALTDKTVVWAVGAVDGGVLEEAAAAGATVIDNRRDPMVELVMIHRAAVALANARGLDPDQPRFLSRSVVLQAVPDQSGRAQRGEDGFHANQ
jgi:fructoselysine-6-P-deglycase FrlB-like protein